ncbi:MAG: carbohydrate kinase family protein, partial [Nanoarchaeota archaeon]
LYCSSMLGSSFKTLVRVVRRAKAAGIRYAFNPSMYLARQGIAKLKTLIDDCDLLVLNKEEAAVLLGTSSMDVRGMLKRLQQHAKLVVITDGAAGAFATNGIDMFTAVTRNVKVVETTGAGDAFASGVVAGLIERNDLAWGLKCGLAQSESVIKYVGAKNKLLSCPALIKAAAKHTVRVEAL